MTKAAVNDKARGPAANGAGQVAARLVPLKLIDVGAYNPRSLESKEEQAALEELTRSVAERGVISPIKVRPIKGGRFELIYGQRRKAAAERAKLKEIPAIVAELSDEDAQSEALIENIQRRDVNPMEEAEALMKYAELHGLTDNPQELARRVSKSVDVVLRRLKFKDLIPEAAADLRAGLISEGHARELCRLSPEIQKQGLINCFAVIEEGWDSKSQQRTYKPKKEHGPGTVVKLQRWINEKVPVNLSAAPFKLDDDTLGGHGACVTCPYRTGTNKTLFPEAAKDNTCTDPKCFALKTDNLIRRKQDELKNGGAKQVLHLSTQNYLSGWERKGDLRGDMIGANTYSKVDKKNPCDYAVQGIIVDQGNSAGGGQLGHVLLVCTDEKCKDHKGRSARATVKKADGTPDPVEVKKKRQRRQELFDARVEEPARRRVLVALLDKINPDEVADRPGELPWPLPVADFRRFAWEHFDRIPSDTQRVIYETLDWRQVLEGKSLYNHERAKKARPIFDALPERDLVRFMFLCSVAHYGENLNPAYGRKDQQAVVALAVQYGVPYQLFLAREAYRQSPGKKYYGAHGRHLFNLLLGKGGKRPDVFADEKEWSVSTIGLDFEVEQKVTPFPMLDGPEGVVLFNAAVRFWRGDLVGTVGTLIDARSATTEEVKARDADQPWNAGARVTCVVEVGGVPVEAGGHELVYVNGVEAELEARRSGQVKVPTREERREAADLARRSKAVTEKAAAAGAPLTKHAKGTKVRPTAGPYKNKVGEVTAELNDGDSYMVKFGKTAVEIGAAHLKPVTSTKAAGKSASKKSPAKSRARSAAAK